VAAGATATRDGYRQGEGGMMSNRGRSWAWAAVAMVGVIHQVIAYSPDINVFIAMSIIISSMWSIADHLRIDDSSDVR
jgi:hypothetical protein